MNIAAAHDSKRIIKTPHLFPMATVHGPTLVQSTGRYAGNSAEGRGFFVCIHVHVMCQSCAGRS